VGLTVGLAVGRGVGLGLGRGVLLELVGPVGGAPVGGAPVGGETGDPMDSWVPWVAEL
jgi:hypothetical protein